MMLQHSKPWRVYRVCGPALACRCPISSLPRVGSVQSIPNAWVLAGDRWVVFDVSACVCLPDCRRHTAWHRRRELQFLATRAVRKQLSTVPHADRAVLSSFPGSAHPKPGRGGGGGGGAGSPSPKPQTLHPQPLSPSPRTLPALLPPSLTSRFAATVLILLHHSIPMYMRNISCPKP